MDACFFAVNVSELAKRVDVGVVAADHEREGYSYQAARLDVLLEGRIPTDRAKLALVSIPVTRVTMVAKRTAPNPGRKHAYLYDITLDGETIVSDSADPEYDFARALLARGVTGIAETINSITGRPRSRINIDAAAQLTVDDSSSNGPRFAKWRPYYPRETVDGSAPTVEIDPQVGDTRTASSPPHEEVVRARALPHSGGIGSGG
jgi:hypothetical protein